MSSVNNKSRFQIDMCSGPILPKLLRFALPLMATNLLQLMFAAADSVVVGLFAGEDSLAAVGATVSLINLITNLFLGLSVGVNVVAARCFGAKNDEELSQTTHTSIFISAIIGLIMTVIGLIGAEQMLILMKTPPEILPLSVRYLRIYFIGMTSMTIYNFGAALLRAIGDTKRPLIFLLISGGLNILLNLCFVIFLKLGVAGVATSTAITQTLSAALILTCLSRERGGIRFIPKKLAINRKKLGQIVAIGLPAGLQASMYSISNVIIQSSINIFGKTVIAASTASVNIEDMVYFTMNAIQQAVTSFTGQNMGVRNYKRILNIQLIGQAAVIITGVVISSIEIIFAPQLLSIFSDSAEVIAIGTARIRYVVLLYFTCGMMEVFVGGLRGMGSSVLPTIASLIGICAFRVVWLSTVFQIEAYHTIKTVYMLYPITWVITCIAEAICFFAVYRHKKRLNDIFIMRKEVIE